MHDFTQIKGLDPELIEIPAEFEDLPIADLKPKDIARKKSNKKLIRTRTSKTMTNYDAWRCHDRAIFLVDHMHPVSAKFMVPPALLVRLFGIPDQPTYGIVSTGEYNFEDNNLDLYRLFDYKQTDLFHGLNREDDYYTTARNMRKPEHKRKRKQPSVEEFWTSDEPVVFKLHASEKSDVKRFKRWFRAQIRRGLTHSEDFTEKVMAKHGDKFDICLGGWEEKGVINTEMAAHKMVASDFMTEEEHKEYPHGPVELCVPPKMFDLSKAKRVKMTKEEIELMQQEKEALAEEAA